ncbi:MAG: 2-succinyl-5-enolpyruvyl-6-hydroxy-3-cyclohexene-1-carboxylic-acid synthase [Bacteroidota bacterium]
MMHPSVFNTSRFFESHGIKKAVFSPGSRNAPLIVSFARNEQIKKWIIPDERAAGFVALGISQKAEEPVVLCCTSGTAVLNYAPAIAEAYYREIPLIVLSADRPPHLIDQRDGQTIRQHEVLKKHVKASYQLPIINDTASATEYERLLGDALENLHQLPKGPIHINVPFQEPFYPDQHQKLVFDNISQGAPTQASTQPHKLPEIKKEWFLDKKVLLLIGQKRSNSELDEVLEKVAHHLPILHSPLNNVMLHGIRHVDYFLSDQPELKPDVLITTGLSVLSKKLKNFIRKHRPERHLHFDLSGVAVDTYQSNPILIRDTLLNFLRSNDYLQSVNTSYAQQWKTYSRITKESLSKFRYPKTLSETECFYYLLNKLPSGADLHLGNSMPVRFSELFDIPQNIEVWSNRGTSGIDGCTSTAIGTAMVSDQLNVLLTGELAFLYDRNAFFHNYQTKNLRVIVSNNQGGGIFRLIDGPSGLPELEDYFETRHNRTAEYLCKENHIEYYTAKNKRELEEVLADFFHPGNQPKLLEVFTEPNVNQQVFKDLKQFIHEQLNH